MSIEVLLASPTGVRKWLALPEGKRFMEWVNEWREREEKKLKKEIEPATLHRCQGALEVLERICGLGSEIRDYQQKEFKGEVGKVRPLGDRVSKLGG